MKKKKWHNGKLLVFFIIVIGIIIFAIIACKNNKEPEAIKKIDIEELIETINKSQKAIQLLSGKEQESEVERSAPLLLEAWMNFVDGFKDNQPKKYGKTRNWNEKLSVILEHVRKADELVKEKKLTQAREEMEMARIMFKEINKENGFPDISEDLISFHDTIEKIASAKDKKEAVEFLPKLKYEFTVLKEYNIDEKYNEKTAELEKIISNLDKLLDGPEFRKAQNDLEPVFMELYREY